MWQVKPNLALSLKAAHRSNSGIFFNYRSFRQFHCQSSAVRKSEYFIASKVSFVTQSSVEEKKNQNQLLTKWVLLMIYVDLNWKIW